MIVRKKQGGNYYYSIINNHFAIKKGQQDPFIIFSKRESI
ncbi:Uncharacterised protein [Serratia marcescens]|nr:hypothetical protein SCH909_3234 [Serratia marcescens]CUY25475.1 Uncharacterised protein [Serratia marcescens]CUY28434.1 Uncharacterised protein [Serratia marcescens]CUY56651.1 Uncharacterised protein [Serratia marcescens]CUY80235.1 Uncharacterised protein [Serratia marcescens]